MTSSRSSAISGSAADVQQPTSTLTHDEGLIALGEGAAAEAEPVALEAKQTATRVSSPLRDAWRRYRRNWAAMGSLIIVLIIIVMAVFAPLMHTTDPTAIPMTSFNFYGGPTGAHWLGTDGVGRDIWSRMVYGARVPLIVGFIGTIITVGIGTLLGVFAGYLGGFIDSLISRVTDVFLAFPVFLLVLLFAALYGDVLDPVFGGSGRVILLTMVFALVSWPALTRFVRGVALSLRDQQYVEAARTSGSGTWKIVARHLLPNMWGLILVQAALLSVGIIYIETTLSLFSLGVQPPAPDPGQILYDGATQLSGQVPPGIVCEVIFPAIFFGVLLLALTFIGDGVRDAVDPRMNS